MCKTWKMHSYFYVFQWKVTGMPVKLGPNVLNLLIRKYTQKIPWSAFTNFVSETDGYTYSRASPFERILFLFFFSKKLKKKKRRMGPQNRMRARTINWYLFLFGLTSTHYDRFSYWNFLVYFHPHMAASSAIQYSLDKNVYIQNFASIV